MRAKHDQFWDDAFLVSMRAILEENSSAVSLAQKIDGAANIADYALLVREDRRKKREVALNDEEERFEKQQQTAPTSPKNPDWRRLDIECEDEPTTPATDGQK